VADPAAILESYLGASPDEFTYERVRTDLYYVRIRVPGLYLGWLPVEIFIGERTVRLVGGFSVLPRVNEAEAYGYLLRTNLTASGFCFAVDKEGRIVLTGRIAVDDFDPGSLDAALGRLVDLTESAVGSYLSIGFDPRPAT
jgi:hypothetical protein